MRSLIIVISYHVKNHCESIIARNIKKEALFNQKWSTYEELFSKNPLTAYEQTNQLGVINSYAVV